MLLSPGEEVVNIRKVELTMNEQKKYETIKRLVEKNGNKQRAAVELGCTVRTINRLIVRYKNEGKSAFSHGNKNRPPSTRISEEQRLEIITLYENKYYDANIVHFKELLEEHEGIRISENSLRSILYLAGILSPRAHKSTKKRLKKELEEKIKNAKSKKKQADLQKAILEVDEPHPRRPRCKFFGEMQQMDASPHEWFGGITTHLHASIDDSTGIITGAYFDTQETLHGYYRVAEQILKKYGIPYMFYTDRRTVFEYKKSGSTRLEDNGNTQFGYACKQLGIELKTTSVPQAKGRIERLFETLQSRLPIELRLAGVTTIEQANEFLRTFLPKFNSKFALPVDSIKSVFELQLSDDEIDRYLAVITKRHIDSGHCIQFNNKYFQPVDSNGMAHYYRKGVSVLVIRTLSGNLYCSVDGRIFVMDEVPEHEKHSRYFCPQKEKPEKRYIPPMDHPWRKDNFMKFVYAMRGKEENWAS